MKRRAITILVLCSSLVGAAVDEASLTFKAAPIELPPLTLEAAAKTPPQGFFRKDGPWYKIKKPLFGVENKQATPGILVPKGDLDPKMIIPPDPTIDYKMRIIPVPHFDKFK